MNRRRGEPGKRRKGERKLQILDCELERKNNFIANLGFAIANQEIGKRVAVFYQSAVSNPQSEIEVSRRIEIEAALLNFMRDKMIQIT